MAPSDRAFESTLPTTIFLLSPARCTGDRARMLTGGSSRSALARQLDAPRGAPLGEVFTFLSALYFRGKLTYARTFARPPPGLPGIFIITPGAGLKQETERVTALEMRTFAAVNIDRADERYAAPLLRDARALATLTDDAARFVLLGSIASDKYVGPLLQALGERLMFPADFVGRGDMSRGGLLLRASREGHELAYAKVLGAPRHGPRPPRLPPVRRRA